MRYQHLGAKKKSLGKEAISGLFPSDPTISPVLGGNSSVTIRSRSSSPSSDSRVFATWGVSFIELGK